jgi:hypothetical protein
MGSQILIYLRHKHHTKKGHKHHKKREIHSFEKVTSLRQSIMMKLFFFTLVIAVATAFSPQPVGRSTTATDANVQEFLDRIFSPNQNKQEMDMSSSTKAAAASVKKSKKKADSWIADVFNNFEPLHGHGSGETELEEIQKTQEQLLSQRKSLNKDTLKQKYRDWALDHHGEIPMIAFDPKDLNKKEDDAMYLDGNSMDVPSFHIEEAADSLVERMNNWVNKQAKADRDLNP